MSFTEKIKASPGFIGSNGRTEEEICYCEEQLALRFAPEYRAYLSTIGLACFDGIELTGICGSKRLNVVNVTNDARKRKTDLPNDLYVVEECGIDGIVILQNAVGEVFQVGNQIAFEKVSNSLEDYYFGN